ncbi:MAG TPA: TonB-dependent receptor plug domain-containing protein [Chryseolinea sp.]
MKKIYGLLMLIGVLNTTKSWSQEQEIDYYALSLEELMNIPIHSASKKEETLFDAPLSSYTITRSDIDKAGATSIPEALRLSPGIIVREQTNGVYDVHIRGFDNVLGTSEVYTKSNLATLVMIDNRPVFNHNLGGTFWEALPVDIGDVERIEIVRGPSAPLFGPNAVTGVINIITKRVEKGKSLVHASVQAGAPSSLIGNVAVGKSFGKFNALVSGNYQKRERFDEEYYIPAADSYFSKQQLEATFGTQVNNQYPDPALALDKFGINTTLGYTASDKVNFSLGAGIQQSETQKIFLSNVFNGGILFTTNETETSYINLSGKVHGLSFRTSYVQGHDDLAKGAAPNQYDYDVFDATAEYTFKVGDIGSIVPGIGYQSAVYGDEEYISQGLTFLNGTNQSLNTASGFIRTDWKLLQNFRVLAAIRADKFSAPDDVYLAYELAATYRLNSKNLVRTAITKSNSGSFIGNNFLDLQVENQPQPGLTFLRRGQQDLELFTVNMVELGFRTQVTKNLQVDFDIFQQRAMNFTALTTVGLQIPYYIQEFDNVPTTATQYGFTISVNYIPNEKFQLKPFITAQKTTVEDLPSSFNSPDVDPTLTYTKHTHKNTPAVYGGYFINYKPFPKLNINLNGYYFSGQRQYDGSDPNNQSEAGDISGVFHVNSKVNYRITPQINIFLNGRNILNSDSREFFGADKIGASWFAGASFNLN